MLPTRALLVVCFLVLQHDVISAAKLNFVGYFEVKETGTEQQEDQPKQTQFATNKTDTMTSDQVVTSAKDAAGLYKLSYDDYDMTWEQFKIDHKRVYTFAREERERFAIFMDTVKEIERHNWRFHNGLTTYWMDINQFADWTPEEWQAMLPTRQVNVTTNTQTKPLIWDKQTPFSIDWRDSGYVTEVKEQRTKCNSGYAFSAVGAIESQSAKNGRPLIDLSVQQVVDCSDKYGNSGCLDGTIVNSFEYLEDVRGIESELAYPYIGKAGVCGFDTEQAKVKVAGFVNVPYEGNEYILKDVVGNIGPVSVGICASFKLRLYRGGLFEDINCRSINHGALVVGYGYSSQGAYWIVKNSWGVQWGQNGYVYIARNRNNMCQIATSPSYPTL